MKGWKTKVGALLIGASQVVPLAGLSADMTTNVTHVLVGLGGLFSVWGIGHKIEKNGSTPPL